MRQSQRGRGSGAPSWLEDDLDVSDTSKRNTSAASDRAVHCAAAPGRRITNLKLGHEPPVTLAFRSQTSLQAQLESIQASSSKRQSHSTSVIASSNGVGLGWNPTRSQNRDWQLCQLCKLEGESPDGTGEVDRRGGPQAAEAAQAPHVEELGAAP